MEEVFYLACCDGSQKKFRTKEFYISRSKKPDLQANEIKYLANPVFELWRNLKIKKILEHYQVLNVVLWVYKNVC